MDDNRSPDLSAAAQARRQLAPFVTLSPLTLLLFCEQYLTPVQMAEAWDREDARAVCDRVIEESTRKGLRIVLVWLLLSSAASAAPIYADVSIEGGIHFWSDDTFIAKGYSSPLPDLTSTIENEFDLGTPVFDGKHYRIGLPFPAVAGACTYQFDAFWHGGWWGEVRHADCAPTPLCLVNCQPTPRCVDCEQQPVPEPATWALLLTGALLARRIRSPRRAHRCH